ncbi:MAG: nucleotide exchange factor GrpE [Verrucomicrobia bacterium]|nr:nucleotide exchange factor GrpE [Verrucomicrobiota bacterium]
MTKNSDSEAVVEPDHPLEDEKLSSAQQAKAMKADKASRKAKKKSDKAAASNTGTSEGLEEDTPAQAQSGQVTESAGVLQDRLLRLQADFENFRKRTQRERDDLYRMANADIMTDLLPVLDNFQLALQATGDDVQSKAVAEGVKLVADQLAGTLKKYDLVAVEAVGEVFDPNMHEALSQAPSHEFRDHVVMFQHRCGYRLGAKLLRPAQVVISIGPGPEEAPLDTSAEGASQARETPLAADAHEEG